MAVISQATVADPKVSVVVTTHGVCEYLDACIGTLKAQREYIPRADGKVLYICNGKPQKPYPFEIVVSSDGPYQGPEKYLYDPQITVVESDEPKANWGHHTRFPGVQAARGEWVTLTNQDNLYVHGFMCRILPELKEGVGVVYWNVLNNLWLWGSLGGCQLRCGRIDLACVCVRTDIALEVGYPSDRYEADWDWINLCLRKSQQLHQRVTHINEQLYIHN